MKKWYGFCVGVALAVFPSIVFSQTQIEDTVVVGDEKSSPVESTCKVELCCYPIQMAAGLAWHCFVKCTETTSSGDVLITGCSGRATGLLWDLGVGDLADCPGWTILDGAWGPIDTYCGPFGPDHPDYFEEPNNTSCETPQDSGSCDVCDCIEDVMCRIQKC